MSYPQTDAEAIALGWANLASARHHFRMQAEREAIEAGAAAQAQHMRRRQQEQRASGGGSSFYVPPTQFTPRKDDR